jgi:hypothetical protein
MEELIRIGWRRTHLPRLELFDDLTSHDVLIKSSCTSRFPHKPVNLSVILVIMKDKLTDLCGN